MRDEKKISLWDITTGAQLWLIEDTGLQYATQSKLVHMVSRDTAKLAYMTDNGELTVRSLKSGQEIATTFIGASDFSRDNRVFWNSASDTVIVDTLINDQRSLQTWTVK